MPPVQAVFWRWTVALLVVAPFGARAAWRQRHVVRRRLGWLTLTSFLGVTAYNTLVHQAGLTTPAATMGLVMAAAPVLMAVYERIGGVRLGPRRTAGLLTAFGGVVLLLATGSGTAGLPGPSDLWIVAAAGCFASYSAMLRRRPRELDGPALLFTTFALGTLMLVPPYAAGVALSGGFPVTVSTAGPLLYLGVLSSAVAFFAWNKAVALVGAARAGLVYYLQPLCAALLALLLLGEEVRPAGLLAMGLVLGGVALGSAERRRGKARPAGGQAADRAPQRGGAGGPGGARPAPYRVSGSPHTTGNRFARAVRKTPRGA